MKKLLLSLSAILALNATNAQVNLNSGLLVYLPLNGNTQDHSGNGNHAINHGGVTYTNDNFGNANASGRFDGVNDWLEVLDSGDITLGKKATVAFKFLTESTAMQDIINKAEYNNAGGIQFEVEMFAASVHSNNNLFFATEHNNSCSVVNLASHYIFNSAPTVMNRWYCVVMTFDSGGKKMYIDGQLAAQGTVSGFSNNYGMDSCQSDLKIGVWWQNYPWWYKGAIDEVRLYNRVLGTEELDSICNYNSVKALAIENAVKPNEVFEIYPNPSDGNSLNISGLENIEGGIISITDQVGRVVISRATGGNERSVDISGLKPGSYIVELRTGTQRMYKHFTRL